MNTFWTEAAQLYLILHQSCFSLKSDHQDLLRSFTFTVPQRRNDLLRSLYYSSLNQHCIICLDHLHLILLRHIIIGDIERPLIFRSFYVSICSTVIKISLIYITSSRISYRYQHLQQIHISAQFESLNKTEQFFPYSHYIRLYEP